MTSEDCVVLESGVDEVAMSGDMYLSLCDKVGTELGTGIDLRRGGGCDCLSGNRVTGGAQSARVSVTSSGTSSTFESAEDEWGMDAPLPRVDFPPLTPLPRVDFPPFEN